VQIFKSLSYLVFPENIFNMTNTLYVQNDQKMKNVASLFTQTGQKNRTKINIQLHSPYIL
jgi:hypothetical protein